MANMKRISVPADDLLDLINEYECWAGTMDPEDAEEYLTRFKALKAKAQQAVKESENAQP